MTALPIEDALPDLISALKNHGRAVLQAPPGAGKTTRVPLALLDSAIVPGKIVMLEPRRLATRASAERMASTLNEPVGKRIGYRMRGESRTGPETRIEVVTEGILTRMIQTDPELSGIGAVIFDEFHERSLNADLGLALCLEVRSALRDDLRLLVMSATLDAEPVAALLDDAPLITSQGRSFPVATHWLDRPLPPRSRLETAAADLVESVVSRTEGGVLCFLPGEGEIRRTAAALDGHLPSECEIMPLFGAMKPADQRRVLSPAPARRKVVLATSIAETSLTIDGIRVVVDAGRSRRARFDPGSGMSRLVTERVTRAEAEQRRGRAGRVAPGDCFRLWTKGEEGALSAFPPAEIESADLTGLSLELALWGASEDDLSFLTPPPAPAMAEARGLLQSLGALDSRNHVTDHGRALAAMPLHPRLGHMLALCGPATADLAALLADRDPLRGASSDLATRLRALRDPNTAHKDSRPALARLCEEAKRLRPIAPANASLGDLSIGAAAALAYPDRIGLRRKGAQPRYVLSGGKGAHLPDDDSLAGSRMIVATDTDGNPREARIRLAAPVAESEIRALFATRIKEVELCEWSRRSKRVDTRRQERLGAIVLSDQQWKDAPADAVRLAAIEGIRSLGLASLKPSKSFDLLRARIALAREILPDLPDPSEESLLATAEQWLGPYLGKACSEADFKSFDPTVALRDSMDWSLRQKLDQFAPPHYRTPLGREIAIDYAAPDPEISLRLQEMLGEGQHPSVAGRPLRVTLLSPAGRPVQTTMDLPGFWRGSYADVRKDMRARYPKHHWPEDPLQADPTLWAKPRK
ncbi:ATP-dependent helicase HrpB [Qingshengfaniella alkalisoli]|uniref:ATP-dependent helicase HrpB n=1 Tax=Qingshengfaniella alkalisoli TaxID=2599296 RepID=A0A5B8IW11_9RHOB|nr:ATP-dependent helicase HrpB [Qingshengfaniella alkalisoli]QDY69824.1 ATP-dependent helicase HrpB [Qingshengfaniella alkalisoli]